MCWRSVAGQDKPPPHSTQRGGRVVAVELGPEMAAVARRNLAAFPTVQVVTSAFEDWPLPIEPFDLVFAGAL